MSEHPNATVKLRTRPLGSMVLIDPESLPLSTSQDFSFSYVDIASVTDGRLRLPESEIDYRNAPSRARRVIRNGDVLVSTVRPNLKAFAYCDLPAGNFVASTGFAVLRAIDGNDSRFILYSVLSDAVGQQIESRTVGSNYPAINSSDVRRLQLPFFEPTQQRRIAEILSALDETIEQTEALIAKHQQIKAGLMHDLFTRGVTPNGKLRPTRSEAPQLYKESALGWIPKEWEIVTTEHFAAETPGATTIGPFGSDLLSTDYREEGVPVIFVRDVKENAFEWNSNIYVTKSKAQQLAAHAVKSGDILSTKMGLPPCISCRYPSWMDQGVITADIIRLRPDTSMVDIRWLSAALNSNPFKRQVQAITAGVTRPKITLSDFRKLNVSCPLKGEQILVADRLESVDSLLSSEYLKVTKFRKQKHGLMHDLLTGRVRVKVDA